MTTSEPSTSAAQSPTASPFQETSRQEHKKLGRLSYMISLFHRAFGHLQLHRLIAAGLAFVQNDIKKIIAYSSISHLGYVMLGLISLDLIGIQGAVIQMGMAVMAHNGAVLVRVGQQRLSKRGQKFRRLLGLRSHNVNKINNQKN